MLGQACRLFARLHDQLRVLFDLRTELRPRGNEFRVADDRGEQVVEIVRHTAGQTPDSLHLLRMAQLFLALAQRFLGCAAFPHLFDQPLALLEELVDGARKLAKFRAIACHDLDRLEIVARQAGHDLLEGPVHPLIDAGADEQQEDDGKGKEHQQHALAGAIQLVHDR